MASFSNQDLSEAIDVMRTKVHLLQPVPDQPVQLTSTGVGSQLNNTKFNSAFNAKSGVVFLFVISFFLSSQLELCSAEHKTEIRMN